MNTAFGAPPKRNSHTTDRPLIDWITEVFESQGPVLHLKQVYKEVRQLGYQGGGTDLNKLIRKRIYEHSSDSPQYLGDPHDFFRVHGESGSGFWELRKPVAPASVEDQDRPDDELDRLIQAKLLLVGTIPADTPERLARQQRGRARVQHLAVENYQSRCAVCDVTEPTLLVGCHVVGWDEDPKLRGDLSNVIGLCRMHAALFESGYWSLDANLKVTKKKSVASKTIRQLFDAMTPFRKPLAFPPAASALKRHRERVGFKV